MKPNGSCLHRSKGTLEGLRARRPALEAGARAAAGWFHLMTIPATHRLHYSYNPATRRHEDRHCPIRDIGSAADLAEVQRWFRGTREFDPVIHSTLEHYAAMLRPGEAAGAEHGW